jgi:hypothetical protein
MKPMPWRVKAFCCDQFIVVYVVILTSILRFIELPLSCFYACISFHNLL